jgi:hypothetical protein
MECAYNVASMDGLGSAFSFCSCKRTGTLEHETEDCKQSHHRNCRKQVGE